MSPQQEIKKAANTYAEKEECDVLLFCGDIDDNAYEHLKDSCHSRNRNNKILLILFTRGGDAHVAYRIGRCLQRCYKEVRIFVNGRCKSAGTLLAVSGHKLIIGDEGELGPIDVQQMRQDELWERASGLVESAAIDSLAQVSWDLFERMITEIKGMSFGRITFKTAAEAAAPIVSGALSPIFAQIDPLKMGETARALRISSQYAQILDKLSKNLRNEFMAIDKLVTGYPDHSFIIDREEANTLFKRVSAPDDILISLAEKLGDLDPDQTAIIFLNEEVTVEEPSEEMHDDVTAQGDGVEEVGEQLSPYSDLANAKKNKTTNRENGEAGDNKG